MFTGIFFRKALIVGGEVSRNATCRTFRPMNALTSAQLSLETFLPPQASVFGSALVHSWPHTEELLLICRTQKHYSSKRLWEVLKLNCESTPHRSYMRSLSVSIAVSSFLRCRSTFATLARRPSSGAASTWRTPLAGRTSTDARQGTTPWPT